MINKHHPLNRDYNRDPNIKALERKGFIHHESTLPSPTSTGLLHHGRAQQLRSSREPSLVRGAVWGLGVGLSGLGFYRV